ncbi:hypothetical protein [Oceanibium sediminis]|uniref:hypothetical protein n=1 Tax=Oceanibium sediminis TaxID=2026339 RepID=UPI00130080C5|nr:hypothetical protein [Oceanibium sediminis]
MKHYNNADNPKEILEAFSASARPTLTIDVARYEAFLESSGLTPEQKEEFLGAIWSIIVPFVELGYGVHPLQEACGKDRESGSPPPEHAADAVSSEDHNTVKTVEKPAPPGKPEVK